MKKRSIVMLILLLTGLAPPRIRAAHTDIDSLQKILLSSGEDSAHALTLIKLSKAFYLTGELDQALRKANEARKLSAHLSYKNGLALSFNMIGNVYQARGDYPQAFQNHTYALKIRQETGDQQGIGSSLNNLGNIGLAQGNFVQALDDYQKAQKIFENIHYEKGLANIYTCTGNVYLLQGEYGLALEEHFKSLKIEEQSGTREGICAALNNIGIVYSNQNDFDKALEYHTRSLKIGREIGYKENIALSLNNIGYILESKKKYTDALLNYNDALSLFQELGNKKGIANSYSCLGNVYMAMNDYPLARQHFQKAFKIQEALEDNDGISVSLKDIGLSWAAEGNCKEALDNCLKSLDLSGKVGSLDDLKCAHEALSIVYEKMHDGKKALEHYLAFVAIRDSVFNLENTRKSVRAEMNFEFGKHLAIEEAEEEKKSELMAADARKRNLVLRSFTGILGLSLCFALFLVRSYRQKSKANRELDVRNHKITAAHRIIEEKNLEILDSINYALRIQEAILPDLKTIPLPDTASFLLFRPKDIVSGDFYWVHDVTTPQPGRDLSGDFFIAAVDCTGHGVPGACMSMIGSEKLREAVQHNPDPGIILSLLNRGIKASLHQTESRDTAKDGMDIALCYFQSEHGSRNSYSVRFAGANRPLWIIRKDSAVIEEIKGTKADIGGYTADDQIFETNTLRLNSGDACYLFSDGYADQFGGENGKKLGAQKFRDLLLRIKDLSMSEQQERLHSFFKDWRKNSDQVDDILVIGLRL